MAKLLMQQKVGNEDTNYSTLGLKNFMEAAAANRIPRHQMDKSFRMRLSVRFRESIIY